MIGDRGNVFKAPKILRLDDSIEALEIDFSAPRIIQIIPLNSKGRTNMYYLKITPKGGATLV